MESKNKIIIMIGCSSLFIIFQFFFFDYLDQRRLVEHAQVFEKGYNVGLEVAIKTIFNNTQDCNVTTIFVENSSKQIIDFSCYVDKLAVSLP